MLLLVWIFLLAAVLAFRVQVLGTEVVVERLRRLLLRAYLPFSVVWVDQEELRPR